MKHILAKAQRPILDQFAWSRVLLGFDFDGTLAPIVREPGAAKMRKATHERLAKVARRYPCAVISGRGRADVGKRVRGVSLVAVVGNHGLESTGAPLKASEHTRVWARQLEGALADLAGVEVENKGPSIAVHYRKSRARRAAKRAIDHAISALDGPSRVIPGKLVLNVLPEGAPHKGIALEKLRAAARADTAIYVGDDVTDEDVFMLDDPGRLLSIRIGRAVASAAPYYLRSQAEIDDLLDYLIACRAAPKRGGRSEKKSVKKTAKKARA